MFNIVLMLVITIDAAFLTIILSEMIYVVKKLPTLVFWGKFLGCPYRSTGITFGLDTALTCFLSANYSILFSDILFNFSK